MADAQDDEDEEGYQPDDPRLPPPRDLPTRGGWPLGITLCLDLVDVGVHVIEGLTGTRG